MGGTNGRYTQLVESAKAREQLFAAVAPFFGDEDVVLRALGLRGFAWLLPNESFVMGATGDAQDLCCPHGGFAYFFETSTISDDEGLALNR